MPSQYSLDRLQVERETEVETFRRGGPGGQHRNVTDSGIRLLHRPSGVRVTASESRSQHRNRELAFTRLIERLRRLNERQRPRVPTKPGRGAAEQRLAQKRRRQSVKERRRTVDEERE